MHLDVEKVPETLHCEVVYDEVGHHVQTKERGGRAVEIRVKLGVLLSNVSLCYYRHRDWRNRRGVDTSDC